MVDPKSVTPLPEAGWEAADQRLGAYLTACGQAESPAFAQAREQIRQLAACRVADGRVTSPLAAVLDIAQDGYGSSFAGACREAPAGYLASPGRDGVMAVPPRCPEPMNPAMSDLGPLPRAASSTLDYLNRWQGLRTFLVWTFFITLFGLLFIYTR